MATMEETLLAHQAAHVLTNFRSNLRDNCADYKAKLAAGASPSAIAAIARADGTNQFRFFDRIDAILVNAPKRTKLLNGLSALGIAAQTAQDSLTELKTAAAAFRDNTATTKAQLDALFDGVLASLAGYERIW